MFGGNNQKGEAVDIFLCDMRNKVVIMDPRTQKTLTWEETL